MQETTVATPPDVWGALAQARGQGRRLVVMLVRGRDGQHWLPLLLSSMQ